MIQPAKTKQSKFLPHVDDDERENQLVLETEQEAIADLFQEEAAISKPKKSKHALLRWSVYGLLAVGITGLALPSFYQQTGCLSRSAEGISYVSRMNTSQQTLWLKKGDFGQSIYAFYALGDVMPEETNNYKYEVKSFQFVSYQYAISKNDKGGSVVGAVFVLPEDYQGIQRTDQHQTGKIHLTTVAIICESFQSEVKTKLPKPFIKNGKPTCAEGTDLTN